jgi:LysM repeat protein/lysophospholipase L1-like esterase
MKKIRLLGIALVFNLFTYSVAQSTIDTTILKKALGYGVNNSYIQFDKNTLEWFQKDAIYPFFEKLKNASTKKVKILHIGDSHIQPDIGTGVTRNKLQQLFGYGGRGLIFPYQLANTASAYDYTAFGTGKWQSSKNVEYKPKLNLGLSGITVYTNDSTAGFKIVFKGKHGSIHPDFKKIKLYCHKSIESFDVKFSTNSSKNQQILTCSKVDGLPYVEFDLSSASDTLIFNVVKSNRQQTYFECYGVEIENLEDKGVEYISVGIAGAAYQSIFYQNKMKEQLIALQPDLVIFDLGVNNFYKGPFDYPFVMGCLNQMISFVRSNCPNASFLIPNSQDIYYKLKNVVNCKEYSMLTRLVAKQQKVALYDYFNITGGHHSMLNWSKDGLSNKDQCHLSGTGYRFKGELLFNGIMNGYLNYLKDTNDSCVVFSIDQDTLKARNWVIDNTIANNCKVIEVTDKMENYKKTSDQPKSITPSNAKSNAKKTEEFIIVKAGDTLTSLASRFKTTVQEIKSINQLTSDNLNIGQKLMLKR